MKKTLFFSNAPLFFLAIFFVFVSCNNNDAPDTKKDTNNITANTAAPAASTPALILNGHLDTLWIDAATFNALGPGSRITFKFYDTLDAFTLRGWIGNSNNWNNRIPDVRLLKGRQSPVMFGSGSYFGNLQLSPDQYNAIRHSITTNNAKYIVFGPVNPTTAPDAGQITYTIFVTSDDPANFSPSFKYQYVLDPTGVTINPSPPKNSL